MDRDRFAECSKSVLSKTIPPVFQYFNDSGAEYEPRIGSYFRLTDYCPFPIAIVRVNLLLYNIWETLLRQLMCGAHSMIVQRRLSKLNYPD